MFSQGISKEGDLLDSGVEIDLIKKSGAFYSYGDIRLGQGREVAKDFLKENPDLVDEIEGKLRAHFADSGSEAQDNPADKTSNGAKPVSLPEE